MRTTHGSIRWSAMFLVTKLLQPDSLHRHRALCSVSRSVQLEPLSLWITWLLQLCWHWAHSPFRHGREWCLASIWSGIRGTPQISPAMRSTSPNNASTLMKPPPLQLTHLLAAGMMQVTDPLCWEPKLSSHHTGAYQCPNCEHLECYPNTVFKCGKD